MSLGTGLPIGELLELQRSLQVDRMGGDPADFVGHDRIQFFKDMKMALTSELQEALDEIGWKPWASSRHFNDDAVKGELIDALHFLLNLMLVAGFQTGDEISEAYLAKRRKNAARQEEGYDGVSTKCPQCKRALDDEAVRCTIFTDVVEIKEWGSDAALDRIDRLTGGVCERQGTWYVG